MSKFQNLVQGSTPVLIDFFATWCGPCKMMTPVLEAVKEELQDNIVILKVDVDKNPKLAAQYQVRGVPTFLLFQKGQLLCRQSGMLQKNDLIAVVQQHTRSTP